MAVHVTTTLAHLFDLLHESLPDALPPPISPNDRSRHHQRQQQQQQTSAAAAAAAADTTTRQQQQQQTPPRTAAAATCSMPPGSVNAQPAPRYAFRTCPAPSVAHRPSVAACSGYSVAGVATGPFRPSPVARPAVLLVLQLHTQPPPPDPAASRGAWWLHLSGRQLCRPCRLVPAWCLRSCRAALRPLRHQQAFTEHTHTVLFDRSNLLALVIDVLFKHIVVDVQMLLARDVHHIEGKHCTM